MLADTGTTTDAPTFLSLHPFHTVISIIFCKRMSDSAWGRQGTYATVPWPVAGNNIRLAIYLYAVACNYIYRSPLLQQLRQSINFGW